MDDVYKIVISISRHNISYEYLRIGGSGVLQPMAKYQWPQPLAFFCQPNGNIVIGDQALYAVRTETENAYGNYFDNLGKNLTYSICGKDKMLNYLLLDASELLFRDFFSSVLFNTLGPLDNNRSSMPLVIVCDSDVDDNEKAYIRDLFQKGGYVKLVVTQYDQFVEEYVEAILSKQYGCDQVLSVLCDGDDMTFTLIDAIHAFPYKKERLPKLGIDPRVDYVSNQLWNAVCYQNPFLNKDREWQVIQDTAKQFLNSGVPQCHSKIALSDGHKYSYNLTQNSFAIAFDQDTLICSAVDNFLAQNDIKDKSRVLLLLRGNAADNDYFNAVLRRGFDHSMVKRSDKKFIDEINKRIIAFDLGTQPPLQSHHTQDKIKLMNREWREVKAAVNGMITNRRHNDALTTLRKLIEKCREMGCVSLIEEIETFIENISLQDGSTLPEPKNKLSNDGLKGNAMVNNPTEHPTPDEIKSLDREWRMVKASVNGMLTNRRYDDARADVLKFLDKCKKAGYNNQISQVEHLLASIPAIFANRPTPECLNQLKKSWREVRAEANAMIRASRFVEARSCLEQFLSKCKEAGVKEIEADVVAIIATIPRNIFHGRASKETATWPSHNAEKTISRTTQVDEVEKLIKERRLVDARNLCKKQGDDVKVGILTKIIRSQKSIDVRYRTLDECRKLKNMSQIESIIKEIDEHINLCESINVPCTEEKKLRKDYKSIK